MSNATWTQALFDTMLDPKGIDYWWTDYGGCASPTPGQFALPATNGCPTAVQKTESTAVLLWSNMIYDSMISKTGRRPLVLSRYGGVGNQRYGIGFSGDTVRARAGAVTRP
jgi:alpha-glucosidase (family GH31 glycosyl hydrolase)